MLSRFGEGDLLPGLPAFLGPERHSGPGPWPHSCPPCQAAGALSKAASVLLRSKPRAAGRVLRSKGNLNLWAITEPSCLFLKPLSAY